MNKKKKGRRLEDVEGYRMSSQWQIKTITVGREYKEKRNSETKFLFIILSMHWKEMLKAALHPYDNQQKLPTA